MLTTRWVCQSDHSQESLCQGSWGNAGILQLMNSVIVSTLTSARRLGAFATCSTDSWLVFRKDKILGILEQILLQRILFVENI